MDSDDSVSSSDKRQLDEDWERFARRREAGTSPVAAADLPAMELLAVPSSSRSSSGSSGDRRQRGRPRGPSSSGPYMRHRLGPMGDGDRRTGGCTRSTRSKYHILGF